VNGSLRRGVEHLDHVPIAEKRFVETTFRDVLANGRPPTGKEETDLSFRAMIHGRRLSSV
jgi:hypothetical protein